MKMKYSKKVFLFRSYILLSFFVLLFLSIVFRLYSLQISHADYYKTKAVTQYGANYHFYDRGTIFASFKDGLNFTLAGIKETYKITTNPKFLTREDLNKLLSFLESENIDYSKRIKNLESFKNKSYFEISKNLDKQTAQKAKEYLRSQHIKYVYITPYRVRYYPANSLASHLTGFVAYNKDVLEGVYGIEKYYNYVLQRDSSDYSSNFFTELLLNIKNISSDAQESKGDIVLSVEPNVQKELEKILEDMREKWSSKRVSAIVYNPNNGEIIAMASSPDFNLNKFREYDVSVFENPLVENVYEMGSIIKAITIACALDSGVITEKSKYNDTGSKTYDGSTIYNYDKRARGVVSVQEILSQSLNIGAAWLYEKMGKKRFKECFERLGLAEETGIDLPNEAHNLVSNLNSPRDIEFATASFGQGVAFTPISTIKALGALATGKVAQPHLARFVILPSGIKKEFPYKENSKKVFKDSTKERVSRMLSIVVDKALLDGKMKKEHYSVAAKTGTAQIASPDGRYYDDKYNHTFFGYFPAFNPRFLVLFINEEPVGAKYASQTLTEPFYNMVDFLINYYNIEPDR